VSYDINGVFSVVHNWATEAASPPIAISKLDTEFAGIATGLSSVYTKTLSDARYAQLGSANTWTAAQTLQGTLVSLQFKETDAASEEKIWEFRASGGDLIFYTQTDAGSAASAFMTVARSGTTVDSITFTGTTIAVAGNQTVSGTLTVNSVVLTPDAGSFTMELATDSSGGSVLASGTAYWKKVGGVVTMRCPTLQAVTTDFSLYLRGIPAACQPSLTGTYTQSIAVPGSVNGLAGAVEIRVAEGVAYWVIDGFPTAFSSGSANKGIGIVSNCGPTITYQVTD
jgi:hypothetical protein